MAEQDPPTKDAGPAPRDAAEFAAWKAAREAEHAAELAKVTARLAQREQLVRRLVLEREAAAAIANAGGSLALLMPHVLRQATVLEDESATDLAEQVRAVAVDATGTPRIGDAQGRPMSLAALVAELRADPEYAPAFEAPGASDGPADAPRYGGRFAYVRTLADLKTDAEKVAFIREHGQAAFVALAAAAQRQATSAGPTDAQKVAFIRRHGAARFAERVRAAIETGRPLTLE